LSSRAFNSSAHECGTIPATFSHTRIDHTHDRPRTPKPARNKPDAATPAKAVEPREKASLHPRNRHQGRYDFPALIKTTPELAKFVITNPYGKESIDFASPDAVRVFNRALLKAFYGIEHWDIPADYLCPPVPGRADYIPRRPAGQHQRRQIPRGAASRCWISAWAPTASIR
jgi:23S rRNA (adenine1618-N6)-methyltransferase